MPHIKNPNDIVERFVSDYRAVFGEQLVSVVMYGSAVTHEYRPGVSDINMAVVLTDNAISHLDRVIAIQRKWEKRRVRTPFFMTRQYIGASLDTFPIEFLDMQSNYRILHGDDVLAHIEIKREHLRLQCERELKGVVLHVRSAYVRNGGNSRALADVLHYSVRRLLPVFKGMLVLGSKNIPTTKADIIASVEDLYFRGPTVLSQLHNSGYRKPKGGHTEIFDEFVRSIEKLIQVVDTAANEGG